MQLINILNVFIYNSLYANKIRIIIKNKDTKKNNIKIIFNFHANRLNNKLLMIDKNVKY